MSVVTGTRTRFQCLTKTLVNMEQSGDAHALMDTIFADKQLSVCRSIICSAKPVFVESFAFLFTATMYI